MAITGRLVILLALCLILSPLPAGLFLSALAVLGVLTVLDLLLATRTTDLQISRDAVAATRLGNSTQTSITITNTGTRKLRGVAADIWVPSAGAHTTTTEFEVAAGERTRVVTNLHPSRRGERRAVCVGVRSFGPLRLVARQRTIAVNGSLKVLPRFQSRKFLPEKLSRLRHIDGAVLVRQRGQGSEFDSIREYVRGDDVRSLDWRATARNRDLMVRTYRPERDRHIVLALDTGRGATTRIGDEPRLDSAIDAALLLGALAGQAGDRVALVAADVAVRARMPLSTRSDVLTQLVAALTPLEANLVETDPQLLATQVLRTSARRSLVVLFCGLDDAAAHDLLTAARAIVRKHELVVASPLDPELAAIAQRRDDTDSLYLAAAAHSALLSRDTVARELRLLGVTVVQAPADTFASAVADAYLDLKAAGRL